MRDMNISRKNGLSYGSEYSSASVGKHSKGYLLSFTFTAMSIMPVSAFIYSTAVVAGRDLNNRMY